MYKLFLCLRYLKSKLIAWLAIGGVALCVMMMLIVVSVMTSFLDKIEEAAKGLFGDIVMESAGDMKGIAYYDKFIEEITKKDPEIKAATPFVLTVGMLRRGDQYRESVQVAGISLPDRAKATDFEEGLFVQQGFSSPTFNPSLDEIKRRIAAHRKDMFSIVAEEFPRQFSQLDRDLQEKAGQNVGILISPLSQSCNLTDRQANDIIDAFDMSLMTPEERNLWSRLFNAWNFQEGGLRNLPFISKEYLEAAIAEAKKTGTDGAKTKVYKKYLDKVRKVAGLRSKIAEMEKAGMTEIDINETKQELEHLESGIYLRPEQYRIILGLGISGLSFRTDKGKIVRLMTPGNDVTLYVAPLGREGVIKQIAPSVHSFTVIDDNCSGVASIDDKMCYIPLETAQKMNHMDARYNTKGEVISPPRCSQIHIKVAGTDGQEGELRRIRGKIRGYWEDFHGRHPDAVLTSMSIQTWRQRQVEVVAPIEGQRVITVIMIGVMSGVAIALIFVILYTIVVQKTREIGIVKAVGASSAGIAWLFFMYGAVISLLGSGLGIFMGWLFVRDINDIHDAVADNYGVQFFSRHTHMFSTIPNKVDWEAAAVIVIVTILAGLLGALVPALRAARMQPVEALRYE